MHKGEAKKILVIEDNKEIAEIFQKSLQEAGFIVDVRNSFAQAFTAFSMGLQYDLIVLDLILPDGDGIEILKFLRQSQKYRNVPVVIVSAKGQELDRIIGLELGADDYVVKPFSLREVILRIRRLIERKENPSSEIIVFGPFLLDKNKKAIYIDNTLLNLTVTEYKILSLLIENPNRVFSREELLDLIWNNEKEYYSRVLDAYICRIRDKLGKYENLLQTVRGLGYRLVD
ncbi:MAG: response regulator transcription factor [Caldimicrobium sp.]